MVEVCPALGFMVVINTTPFAPLEPYMDVDAASFNISMDFTSEGFKKLMLSIYIPSTTYNGSPVPFIELKPLILMELAPPGSLPVVRIYAPGTLPTKADTIFGIACFRRSLPVIVEILPVTSDRRTVSYPITTTSSEFSILSFSTTLRNNLPFTSTVLFSIPTNENFNLSLVSASIENSPLAVVIAVVFFPVTAIVTETSGTLFSSVTCPLMIDFCADKGWLNISKITRFKPSVKRSFIWLSHLLITFG